MATSSSSASAPKQLEIPIFITTFYEAIERKDSKWYGNCKRCSATQKDHATSNFRKHLKKKHVTDKEYVEFMSNEKT